MSGKTKVSGPLTLKEKVYIAEHFLGYEISWIADKLNRTEKIVETYVNKLTQKSKEDKSKSEELKNNKEKIKDGLVNQVGIATNLLDGAAMIPIKTNKYVSPFRTDKHE